MLGRIGDQAGLKPFPVRYEIRVSDKVAALHLV